MWDISNVYIFITCSTVQNTSIRIFVNGDINFHTVKMFHGFGRIEFLEIQAVPFKIFHARINKDHFAFLIALVCLQ